MIYRSPSSEVENNDRLNKLIDKATSDKPSNLLILGDFNFKEIDWLNGRSKTLPSHPAYKFMSTCKNAFLIQNQTEPTRYREGQEASLLDLVLTNRDDIVNEISTEAGLGKSDHVMLLISLNWTHTQSKSERLNCNRAGLKQGATTQALPWPSKCRFPLQEWPCLYFGSEEKPEGIGRAVSKKGPTLAIC